MAGALIAAFAGSLLAKRITVAKLYHFDGDSEGDFLLRGVGIENKEAQ